MSDQIDDRALFPFLNERLSKVHPSARDEVHLWRWAQERCDELLERARSAEREVSTWRDVVSGYMAATVTLGNRVKDLEAVLAERTRARAKRRAKK